MNEVVITGLGVVSPLGNDICEYWSRLLRGETPITEIDSPGSPIHGARSYLVQGGAPGALSGDEPRGRSSGFAVAAAAAALADAGIDPGHSADVIGLCFGTGNGDSDLLEAVRDGRSEAGTRNWFPFGGSAQVACQLGLSGPNMTISTACAAGAYAVAIGADMVRLGEADVVLVGGAEAVSRPAMGAFLRLGAADPLHCRPFDAHRAGTVFGEGAAFMVLESARHAMARHHRVYATVLSSGWSCDGYHPTAPSPGGEQAIAAALDALFRAGLDSSDLAAVISHGTGTPANDRAESRSTATILGGRLTEVPVAAIKASLGHSGGAAGAFSCLTAVLLLNAGLVPPVGTLVDPDPECHLRLARGAPQPTADGSSVLVNAYAFGGNNISVLIGATR